MKILHLLTPSVKVRVVMGEMSWVNFSCKTWDPTTD